MSDDPVLHDRLSNLAAAVPVPPPSPASTLTRRRVTLGPTLRAPVSRSWLPVALVAVLIVAAVGILASGSQPAYGPVVETVRQGDFELTIRAEKGRYAPDEPIEIEASLQYAGPETSIEIGHAFGARQSAVSFGIVEPVIGDLQLQPGWDAACMVSTLARGAPVTVPFQKSGGYSGEGPRGSEQGPFMSDPVLRLEPGTWHVFAEAWFSLEDCSPPDYRLRAEIAITVESASSTELIQPSPSEQANPPQSSTVRDGDFELTIRSGKTRYTTDEAIDVSASLVYRGTEAAVDVSGGLGQIWSRERSGEIVVGFDGALIMICPGSTYEQGVPQEVSIVTARVTADGMEPQPVPRLPAGTWHLYALAGTCAGSEPDAIEFALEAEITIEVEPAAPVPSEIANPEQSVTNRDDDFALTIRSDKTRYTPNEAIDIVAELSYVGPEPSVVLSGGAILGFGLHELGGTRTVDPIWTLPCAPLATLHAGGQPMVIPFYKSGGYGADDSNLEFWTSYFKDPELRLPAGTWEISVVPAFAIGETCRGGSPKVHASVTVTVAP